MGIHYLVAYVVTKVSALITKTKTFGSGPTESYSSIGKCGMSWQRSDKFALGSSVSLFSVWLVAVLKGIISLHRAEEEKPIEIFRARIKIGQEYRYISAFKRNLIYFLSHNYNAKTFELMSSYLTTTRKSARKTDNCSISTQQELDQELPLLFDSYGE